MPFIWEGGVRMKRKVLTDFIRLLSDAVTISLILFFFGGCAHPNYAGKIRDGIYTNPNNTFQVQIPNLYEGKIFDQQITERTFRVSMEGYFCQFFSVTEITPDWEKVSSFENIVDVMGKIHDEVYTGEGNATVIERKNISTEFGEAIYVRRSYSAGTPCNVIKFVGGKQQQFNPPAEAAVINVQSGQRVYVIETMIAETFMGPVTEEYLDRKMSTFFNGFKILR
jgi:hypothetical protein